MIQIHPLRDFVVIITDCSRPNKTKVNLEYDFSDEQRAAYEDWYGHQAKYF